MIFAFLLYWAVFLFKSHLLSSAGSIWAASHWSHCRYPVAVNTREHISLGAYACTHTYTTRREFPGPRLCTETAVSVLPSGFPSVCPDIAFLRQHRRISVALGVACTSPSFSFVSKKHLQLSLSVCQFFVFEGASWALSPAGSIYTTGF